MTDLALPRPRARRRQIRPPRRRWVLAATMVAVCLFYMAVSAGHLETDPRPRDIASVVYFGFVAWCWWPQLLRPYDLVPLRGRITVIIALLVVSLVLP